ncbi:alpha/beta fold hydrolase [Glaciibacter superstes]|uniref:alpha/beta fold hydrolase n=1 Tax=Glaciibacter superstes TaxID=501023 RepID=UPI001FDF453D|nr:alpha/beta fold hydrolase [Glaciibacter superstes]
MTLHFEVFGDDKSSGCPTVLLLPTWSIIRSRFWKLQVPFLARHFRVVTFDGRGTGGSDSPGNSEGYAVTEFAADTLAVMDATGTDRAALVGLSLGALWGIRLAAESPERVLGVVCIGPAVPLAPVLPERLGHPFTGPAPAEGWGKYNRDYWLGGGYADFLSFFFGRMFTEAHSTKQIEDTVGWGTEVAPKDLVNATEGLEWPRSNDFRAMCERVTVPVLVIHGDEDAIRNPTAALALAELTHARLVTIEGGGHGPQGRDPVLVNLLIKQFVDTVVPRPTRTKYSRPLRRPRRVLYLSSPIGLGHARRDIAVASRLRDLHPDVQIDWLAQHPVTTLLAESGERVHPGSSWLASESAHIEAEAGEHDLHAFQAIRRMDEILMNNFMVFHDVVSQTPYDLVIGDEAWDVDYYLHENPELKRFSFAWMTDFVGWLPMASGGAAEQALTADYNAEMIEQRARLGRIRDRSIFVGDPDDIVPDGFGPGLPGIRSWTEDNFDFAGYITGFDAGAIGDKTELRAKLGYRQGERVCVVTVGGSGVGGSLLRRVMEAAPLAQRLVPELRFLVVAGPRIDPGSLPRSPATDIRGYVSDLYLHLAACDLAVVQGGLTTCMELTASSTPFIYFPLANHFEQTFHVAYRLDRHNAGRRMDYGTSTPDDIAQAIVDGLDSTARYRAVPSDGATRAAAMLADLL